MKHLSPEALLDVAEGTVPRDRYPHLAECGMCRDQLAELQATIATVAVDVPEPSPLFWDHLSARVREATAAEPLATEPWWGLRKWMFPLIAAATAAVLFIAISFGSGTTTPATSRPAVVSTSNPSNAEFPAAADDPSLDLLADLAGDLDWDAAAEAGMTMEVGAAEQALNELTIAERVELQRLLHEAMGGSGV